MRYVKLSFSHVEFISQSSKTQTPIPRESPAEIIKRRVIFGDYPAWIARNLHRLVRQPDRTTVHGERIHLSGLGVLFTLSRTLNPRVSVVWIERFGFAMTVMIVLTNVLYTDYFATVRGPTWRESRETSHWLIAYLCVFAYVIFDTRIGLRVASAIAAVAFLPGLLGVQSQQDPSELYSLIRYTSISTALLAFTYLLAYSKEQLHFERVRSSTDELTGLANRRALYAILEAHIARVEDDRVSVILLDVNRFKNINDTFGHTAGDEVLVGFAESVTASVNVGRWGGEEFLLVLPESNLELALAQAEQIRVVLEHHDFEVGQVTASFGVACLHPDESLSDLIRRADLALYAAKTRGRNRVEHQVRVIDQVAENFVQDLEYSSDEARVPNAS